MRILIHEPRFHWKGQLSNLVEAWKTLELAAMAPRCPFKYKLTHWIEESLYKDILSMKLFAAIAAGLLAVASAQSTSPNASISLLQVYSVMRVGIKVRQSRGTPNFLPWHP
jgi:hypothetical protein